MFDNLFWLMGPVASAAALFATLLVVAAPAMWTTCALSKGMTLRPRG
jgi:hypothetical protein